MASIGELSVVLTAVTGPFAKAVQGTGGMLGQFRSQVLSVHTAVAGFVGILTTGAFASWVKGAMTAGDALAKQADALGMGTERLQAFQHAADLAGVSQETLSRAFARMSKTTGEAMLGSGEASRWLERLGLSLDDLAGKKPDVQFQIYADAIKGLGDRTQQAAAAQAIFGDRSGAILNLIDAGSTAIDQAATNLERYGAAISRVDAAKMEGANDALAEAGRALSGIANQAAIHLAPMVELVATKFTDLVARAGGFGAVWQSVASSVVTGFGYILDAGQGLLVFWKMAQVGASVMVQWVVDGVASMVTAWSWLTQKATASWDVIKASAALAWEGVKFGATAAVNGAIIAFYRMQQVFGTVIREMGATAAASRLKGISEVGLEAEAAGQRLIGSASAGIVKANQAIATSADGLVEAKDDLDLAWQRLAEASTEPTGMEDLQAGAAEAVTEREAELAATRSQERWSDQLRWETDTELAEIQRRAELKAEAVAQQQDAQSVTLDEALRTQIAERLAKVQEGLQSETEKLRTKLAEDIAVIQAAQDAQLIDEAAFLAMKEQLTREANERMAEMERREEERRQQQKARERAEWLSHQDILTQSWQAGLEKRDQFNQMHWSRQMTTVTANLEQITASAAEHNKTMFTIHKAVSLANAVVNTAQGVTQALAAYPPPWSFVMAAAQAAAGAVQIATIARTKWQGGSSSGVSVGRSGPNISAGAAEQATREGQPVAHEREAERAMPQQIIYIQARSADDLISVRTIQDLFQQAEEENIQIAGVRFQ